MADERAQQMRSLPTFRLSVETGPHAGMVVRWQGPGTYLIGRAPHAQLALVHDLVASLEHCQFEIGARGCLIRDLGSRQGTVLNGNSIAQSQVRPGDVLEVGMSRLRVTLDEVLPDTTSLRFGTPRDTGQPSPASSSHLAIPGYTITRKIGQGGMGVVYQALRNGMNDTVAIKTIIPTSCHARQCIPLFQREMKLLSQLNHPRIVRFLDSGEHAGQIYLVMEYVDATSLVELASTFPRERQIALYCGVMCQVLEALQYAHERKLVHRDVKPGNILVSNQAGRLHAKLADFGLAKNFELAGLSQLTKESEVRGTLAFMPWEQLHSSRYAKPSADIYSAAATLYYYLTGRPPGHTEPPRSRWLKITSLFSRADDSVNQSSTTSTKNSDPDLIPESLAGVLRVALSAQPRDRFATAADMRTALIPYARN